MSGTHLSAQDKDRQDLTLATPEEFVGSNACKTCHADVWQNFYKNPHFKSIASGKETPDRTGCEGCHGGAKAHIIPVNAVANTRPKLSSRRTRPARSSAGR